MILALGYIVAKPDYYVGYLIDDKITIKTYADEPDYKGINGFVYVKSGDYSTENISYVMDGTATPLETVLADKSIKQYYKIGWGYKLTIEYTIELIKLYTSNYTMTANSNMRFKV